MYLIVGLGNPGLKYKKTPHNAGFMAVDALAKELGIRFRKGFRGQVATAMVRGKKVFLLKPQTYMNLSGESVIEVVKYYKIPTENVIVIYDDKDLAFGKLRLRNRGSGGSHNGMKSVIKHLGTERFHRVRFGIGTPPHGMRLMDYVTSKLSKREYLAYKEAAKVAGEAAHCIVTEGLTAAQQKYSSKP